MALISLHKISKLDKNSRIHQETDCTYNVFLNGEDKIIQFDKETAKFIIELLKDEFNL